MGTTPDEVRAEIEATRARLEGDLDQLGEKIRPKKVAARTAHDARAAAGHAASAVRERAEQNPAVVSVRRKAHEQADRATAAARVQMEAHPRVAAGTQKAGESAQRATRAVRRQAQQNPRMFASVLSVVFILLIALVTLVAVRRRIQHTARSLF